MELAPDQDAYGAAIRAHHEGAESYEIVERDDGWIGPSGGTELYFSEPEDWPERQHAALDRVEGRVLDVGTGAGRHALFLQERGHDVTAIDLSPEAVAVARERGVDDARECDVVAVDEVLSEVPPYDTVVMFGNNFGLVGTRTRAPRVLGALARVTADDASILAESVDPYATDDEAHLDYHAFNRERGRLGGALRIRVRFRRRATPWFDYLLASPEEMREVAAPTPWTVAEVVARDEESGEYTAVLRKA